jgi:hypothetical protein
MTTPHGLSVARSEFAASKFAQKRAKSKFKPSEPGAREILGRILSVHDFYEKVNLRSSDIRISDITDRNAKKPKDFMLQALLTHIITDI